MLADRLRRAGLAVRRAPPVFSVTVGWAILAVYAFPGQMSWDSFEYLHGARHGFYTDSHPPIVSALWAILEIFVAGPTGMFLVQSTCFTLGLFFILRRTFGPSAAGWCTLALLAFPPIMVPLAVIWAHSLMAGLLLLGTSAVLSPRARVRLAGLATFALAVAVRPSAIVATLPLVVLLFEWRPAPAFRRYALAFGAWAAIGLVAFGVNELLTDRHMHRWQATGAVHDVAGTLRYLDRELPDDELVRLLAPTQPRTTENLRAAVRARYTPRDFFPLTHGDKAPWSMALYGDTPAPAAQRHAIERARKELVEKYRGAYLRHRLAVMKRVLGLVAKDRPPAVLPRSPTDMAISLGVGVPTQASPLQAEWTERLTALSRETALFAPWIYAVILLVLLPLAWGHRDLLALGFSAIAFEGALFFIAVDNSYRQSHWLVTCACIVIASLIGRRARR